MTDNVSSNFATVGPGGPEIANASADSSAPYKAARHSLRNDRGQFRAKELPHRESVLVDSVTGQALADQMRRDYVIDAASAQNPDRNRAARDLAMADASDAHELQPHGFLGGGLSLCPHSPRRILGLERTP